MVYIARLSNWVGIIAIYSFAGTSATNFVSKMLGGMVAVSTFGGLVVILVTSSYVITRKQRADEERERIANQKALQEEQGRRESLTRQHHHEIVDELHDIRGQLLASKEQSQLLELKRRATILRDSVSPGSDVYQEIDEVWNLIVSSLGASLPEPPGGLLPSMDLDPDAPSPLIFSGKRHVMMRFLGVGFSLATGLSLGFLFKWLF